MKKLSNGTRERIVHLLNSGMSMRKIEKQTRISKTSIIRIKSEYCEDFIPSKGGRPRALTVRDKAWVVRQITSRNADTAPKVAKLLQDDGRASASVSTVRRALKDAGLKAAVRQKKPRLLPRHMKARYQFAQAHKDWTMDDWKRVIFSDETKINRFGSDGRQWVWKTPGEPIKPHHVTPTVKFGGGSVMVWGCMCYDGVGYACKINGTMDAELYKTILDDELQESIDFFDMDRDQLIFQQDNDPKHTSRIAKKWFADNNIRVLEWPAQSPDLNPIEHLWSHLKKRLNAYDEHAKGINELWERIEHEWNAIPNDICANLIESMPRRVSAVLKAKGGYVKY